MDGKQLAAFQAAYETGSMAKAAEEVIITPQGLSRLIASLEAELGGQLFTRTSQGVVPTDLGRKAYPRTVKILALMQEMRADADDGREVVSVASTSGGLTYFGSALFDDFEKECPDVVVRVEEGNDEHIARIVASGLADCGILSGSPDLTRFDSILLARHPHALIARPDDPLALLAASREDGCVTLEDLQGRTVGIMGEGFSPYNYIRERMLRDCVAPAALIGFAEMHTGIVRVRSEGLCVITTDFVVPPGTDESLTILPFRDKRFTWDEYVVVPRGVKPFDGVVKLRDFLPRWYQQHERVLFPWRSPDGVWPLSCTRARRRLG